MFSVMDKLKQIMYDCAKGAGLACLFGWILLLAGCFVLPIPHYQSHLPECGGLVEDSQSGMPLTNAVVMVKTPRYEGRVASDCEGRFHIAATGGWHLIVWAATPSSGSLLPTHLSPQDEWLSDVRVYVDGECRPVEWFPPLGGTNMVLKVAK